MDESPIPTLAAINHFYQVTTYLPTYLETNCTLHKDDFLAFLY